MTQMPPRRRPGLSYDQARETRGRRPDAIRPSPRNPAFALLACLIAPAQAPVQAQAQAAPILAPDSEDRWVPFDLTPGNQIRFRLQLDGHAATALLDTGLTDTAVSREFAKAARLDPRVAGEVEAIGGKIGIGWAPVRSLGFGGLTRSGGRVAVADLDPLAAGGRDPIDAIVGADLLGGFALEIDYDARRFRLLRSGRLPFRGTSVPLRRARDSTVFQTELTLAGHRLRPLTIDTGDGAAITLSRAAWNAGGIDPAGTTSTIAHGLGGPIETELTIVPELRLGPLAAREVEVRIENGAGFSARTGSAGRIGAGFLQRYRVLLDPGAGRMVLAPGARIAVPPLRSTSGLLLRAGAGGVRVAHVMKHSPAAETGWRAGELICTVNGVPVALADPALASWPVGAPGQSVRLGLCHGGVRELRLRKFY